MGPVVQVVNGGDTLLEHSIDEVAAEQLAGYVVGVEIVHNWHSGGEESGPIPKDSDGILKFDQPNIVELFGCALVMVGTS